MESEATPGKANRPLPSKESVEALLTLIADTEDRAVLDRILEALSIGHPPSDADLEVYDDLWDTFGGDLDEDEYKSDDDPEDA